jgi:hypothetical protein
MDMYKLGLKKMSANPIGQVPAMLGPNSKETKNYGNYNRTKYNYTKIRGHVIYTRMDL